MGSRGAAAKIGGPDPLLPLLFFGGGRELGQCRTNKHGSILN